MKRNSIIKIENYFEFFILIFFISIFIYMIKNFLISIFLAIIFVFFTYKYYKKFNIKLNNKPLSAILIIIWVLVLVFLPIYLISLSLISQSYQTIGSSISLIDKIDILNSCSSKLCIIAQNNLGIIDFNLDKITLTLFKFLSNSYLSIFNSISTIFLDFLIFLLSFYFLLVDGNKFLRYIEKLIPMKSEYKKALFIRFKDVSEAIFLNTILIALIQGFLVGVGFFIFGIPSGVLWGVVASFFALLPMIGTAFVWFPAFIYLLLINHYISAILFLLYGLIIVSLSDNLLQPLLLRKKIQVHPFLILITILGGIEMWGFIGLFLGPIIISILISMIQLYNLDFND